MLEFKVISDLAEAKRLWTELSPNLSIYDLWDFRYAFYQIKSLPLYFYAAYDMNQAVALLPLQENKEWGGLEFIAEDLAFDNRPFIKAGYEYLIPDLFNSLSKKTKIFDLIGEDSFISGLAIEDYVYFYDIRGLNSFADFLVSAFPNGRKRYNFNRLFTILERDHRVETIINDFGDLELLMDFNVKHFGEESYLSQESDRIPFRNLLNLPLDWRMVTIKIDGKKLACSLAVIYQDTYYYLIVGSDISDVPDVFKYLTKANLELALKHNVSIFNCALGDCGWKEFWHFQKRPQYLFIKEDMVEASK